MSYVVFTACVLTLTAAHASAAATIRSKLFSAHLDLSNTPSAVGPMFKWQARSIVHCARLCLNEACCAGFNFAGSGSTPGVCRAYRTGMTSSSSGTSAVRSRTFICRGKEVSGTPTNVAKLKTANQSSSAGYEAGLAVDGSDDTYHSHGSCTHTKLVNSVRAWWQVDLGSSHDIISVIITNRGDCGNDCGDASCSALVVRTSLYVTSQSVVSSPPDKIMADTWDRLRYFDIDVYSENPITDTEAVPISCYYYNRIMAPGITEELQCCNAPITGRFVRITDTPNEYLTLCEVQVMAVPSN